MTRPALSNVPLSQQAVAAGMARYIADRSNASAEEVRRVYQDQCGCDPEQDHEHFVKWLRGWCLTLDATGKR
jgi:hypothetical protein